MGGEPLTALAIVGFPAASLPMSVLTDILRGGQDKVREAGAVLIGGHSIIDEELKFGLSVTGQAHPDRLLTNAAANVGDRLVLTKPLGTGLLATAAKQGSLGDDARDALHVSMCAAECEGQSRCDRARRCAARPTSPVSDCSAMHPTLRARVSVTLVIDGSRLPELPGARALWLAGVRTGGADRNEQYLAEMVDWTRARPEDRALALDPQTSGGLLVAVPPRLLDEYLSAVPESVEIGAVEAAGSQPIVLG